MCFFRSSINRTLLNFSAEDAGSGTISIDDVSAPCSCYDGNDRAQDVSKCERQIAQCRNSHDAGVIYTAGGPRYQRAEQCSAVFLTS